MNLTVLQSFIQKPTIQVSGFSAHSKASELYLTVSFTDVENNFEWTGLIPYHYRRTGIFIETEEDLALYLETIQPFFTKNAISAWIEKEKQYWQETLTGRQVTKPFFDELAKLDWTSAFPANSNPQRRLQDIKEMGYTIASRPIGGGVRREFQLVPIPRGSQTGYEVFSAAFRKKAFQALNNRNIFELSAANKAGLLLDHKFPEIRWDAETKAENLDDITVEEIKAKFQLIDNQRNQQKREVCRNCFHTGRRGIIFGIQFYYEGDEKWETNFLNQGMVPIPKVGKIAELGCIGCGWYDIQYW